MIRLGTICVGGFPGIGSVGKITADCMMRSLDARTVWSCTSPGFPPQVMVAENAVEIFKVEITSNDRHKDLLILSSDAQPLDVLNMNYLAGELLEQLYTMGARTVITLAAHVGGTEGAVYATVTDLEMLPFLEERGFTVMRRGMIGGLNGLLVGMAPLYGLKGICLLGNTSGDLPVDIEAAQSLLKATATLLDLDMPIDILDLSGEETEESEEETDRGEVSLLYR